MSLNLKFTYPIFKKKIYPVHLQDPEKKDEEPADPAERKPRAVGPPDGRVARGDPEANIPPCCRCHFGYPQGLSPFIQVHLPKGFKYMKKASRACSFAEAGGAAVPGGTTRSKQMAIQSVESWAWQWWETLTPIVQASLRGQKHVGVIDAEAAPAAKRIKK